MIADIHTVIASGSASNMWVYTAPLAYFALGAGATVYNSAAGVRYFGGFNSVINTYGQGANRLPGNTAGNLQQGAIYA